ncbi:hypothetical protein C0993_011839 [Termitomyces sp. T159_Od127]|nr:hypothetical protein C0993_011839 [Termitomyces sp. T159_Od127]
MDHNGGSVIAMVGKDCVAIASDLRLGNQALSISSNFQRIFPVTDRIYIGLPGLATDVTTLRERFRFRVNMYTIKEEREIEPETFAHLVSSTLYEHRFGPYFIEPVMAGLSKTPSGGFKPFIAATDLIGCLNFAKDFVVAGTASSKLYGVAEGLWEPDLEPEDLFETISQTLLNAVDRDAFSGWGAIVHVITKDKSLLHGSPEAKKDGELEIMQHSRIVGRGKYVHGFETHRVKPDRTEEYKKAAETYYLGIKNDPKLNAKLTGSWETVVGEQDTFVHILEYENYGGLDKTINLVRSSPEPLLARGFHKLEGYIRYITCGSTRMLDVIDPVVSSDLISSSLEARKELREQAWRIDGWAETTAQLAKSMDSFILKPLSFSPLK